MNPNTTNLRDIKKMRLERHWLQDRLAEMSGLNIRTIQRIENGKNAGLESLKPLLLIRKEEEYVQNVIGLNSLNIFDFFGEN